MMRIPRPTTINPKTTRRLLLFLTGLSFALRGFRLGHHELRGDEAFGLLFSAQPIGDIITQTLHLLEPHPPLDYVLLHFWTQIVGDSEWAIRFTSLAFSVLAVPLVFQLGRLLDSEEAGLWAALLFAINPFQVWHAQEARMYAISAALGLAASVALLRAERTRSKGAWLAFVLLSVTNAYTHYYALFIIVAQGLYWLILWRRHREQLKTWVASQVAIVVLYLPWLVVGWHVMTAYRGNGDSPAFFDMLRRILNAFSLGQTIDPRVAVFLLPVFVLAFVAGWIVLIRRSVPSAVYLALYLCVPVLSVYVSSLSRPVFDERYLIAVTPPFIVVVAAGLAGLPRLFGRRARIVTCILGALVVVASLYSLSGYFFDSEYTRSRGWRELAAHLEEATAPDDVIVQNYPDPTMWYYYEGSTPHIVVPSERPLDESEAISALQEAGETHDRVWFVPYKAADWDAGGFVGTWLDRHWERLSEEGAGSFALRSYRPVRPALADATRVDARWEDQIRLRAYRLGSDEDGQVNVAPGDTLVLTLFWESLRTPSADYTVFVHLLGPSGDIVAQRDSQPLRGSYPTSAWGADEMILDRYVIIVPSDASVENYTMAVGLYNANTGARLPVRPSPSQRLGDRYDLEKKINVATADE